MEDPSKSVSFKYVGKVKRFSKHSKLFFALLHELKPILHDSRFSRIMWLSIVNIVGLLFLLNSCHKSRSLGLRSVTYLVFFDTLCLGICALRIWVEQKKPNQQYTFGYERFEVLAFFLSTTFSFINAIFLIKKSIERWIYPLSLPVQHFYSGIIMSFLSHMIVTYGMKNKGLNLVICATNSMFLPRHIMDFSQNFRSNIIGLNSKVSPRFNPLALIGWAMCIVLIISQIAIDMYDCQAADFIASIFNCLMMCILMYPLSVYSAKVLLQGTPPHIADFLDKCLREASTLDGVLEFRNEHFWLLGYDKIVGSVHVRIRKDANEQSVLSHLVGKLSSLVSDLTIQVFKDEWAWSSSTVQILNESFKKFPPMSGFTPPVSGAKNSLLSDKMHGEGYSATATSSSHVKLPYSSSPSEPKMVYKSTTVSMPPVVPRLIQNSGSAPNRPNIDSSIPVETKSAVHGPRISRPESLEHPKNATVNTLYTSSTNFPTSYKS